MNVVRFYNEPPRARRRRGPDGYTLGLIVKEGSSWAHVVIMGKPIDVVCRPVDVDDYEYQEYDPIKAARSFLAAAASLGITERARSLLETAISEGAA